MNEDPPGDPNEDFRWKCRIAERRLAAILIEDILVFLKNFAGHRSSLKLSLVFNNETI